MCESQSLFSSLEKKVELVKSWPGISDCFSEADFSREVERAYDSGLMGRFTVVSEKYALLAVAVSVFLGSVVETFRYGRDRLRDAIGRERYRQSVSDDPNDQLLLLSGITDRKNCLAIEVVDMGAHYNPLKLFIPSRVRNVDSAHAQVLFVGAQDFEWVRRMNPNEGVPFAQMGGYIFTRQKHVGMPCLQFDPRSGGGLSHRSFDHPRSTDAQPTVWR